jgi:electron transfer flavoprotein beta subunit
MLAGLLDVPQATFVSKLEFEAGRVRCFRETDVGIETLLVDLPAVVTADLRLNEPRYVSLPGILKAKKKPLETIAAAELAADFAPRTTVLRLELPPKRKAGIRVKSVDELLEKLRAATGLV